MSEKEEIARSAEVSVAFYGERCIHSRNCVIDRPDVFVPNVKGEWIHPDRATADEVLEIAHNCPSGAIQCSRSDGSALEQASVVNTVRVRENGPLAFRGELTVRGEAKGMRATLCRCGLSQRKPSCDSSHVAAGFEATGEPATEPSEALATRNGPPNVAPQRNGPLHVTGNVEIISGTGRTVDRVTDAYLCRYGHSSHKPFCDGTHAKIGFQAP